MLTRTAVAAIGLVIALAAASAGAAQPDAKAGKAESALCIACHGAEGLSVATNVPNLAGQHYEYLIEQLIAFKKGSRKAGVMNDIVRPMSMAQLKNIAAYYSIVPIVVAKQWPGG